MINIVFALINPFRYSIIEDLTEPPIPTTTYPPTSTSTATVAGPTVTSTVQYNTLPPNVNGTSSTTSKSASRKGGIIFPSVKNKPSVVNTTFATDILSFKDVKVCRNKPVKTSAFPLPVCSEETHFHSVQSTTIASGLSSTLLSAVCTRDCAPITVAISRDIKPTASQIRPPKNTNEMIQTNRSSQFFYVIGIDSVKRIRSRRVSTVHCTAIKIKWLSVRQKQPAVFFFQFQRVRRCSTIKCASPMCRSAFLRSAHLCRPANAVRFSSAVVYTVHHPPDAHISN